jgi:cob(I)alamin adenosyltransferase
MSIVTKRGDRGQTTLMYNRPASKCHPRVEACGTVDELNAALGLARAAAEAGQLREGLETIQKDLVTLMGELATAVEDLPRYVKEGHSLATAAMTAALEKWVGEVEAAKVTGKGWAMPGANTGSAALDFARTVCRRAERRVCALQEAGQLKNPEILVYLNRLSDLLWLLARQAEAEARR